MPPGCRRGGTSAIFTGCASRNFVVGWTRRVEISAEFR